MKKTWSKLSGRGATDHEQLEWTLDPTANFRNYREELTSLHAQPAVPFFSLIVKDLYFINESLDRKSVPVCLSRPSQCSAWYTWTRHTHAA